MALTADAIRLQEQLDAQVQDVTDAQTRALVAAWVAAWAEVSGDLNDTLLELLPERGRVSKTTMRRSVRLRRVLGQIAARLEDLVEQAGVIITSDLQAVVDDAAAAQADIINAELPATVDMADLLDLRPADDRVLDAIVTRTTRRITSLTRPLPEKTMEAVRRELIRGIAVGSNPRLVASRIVRRSQREFNGGLARALNIARTEMLDAHRAAAAQSQAEHADVLVGWIWLCHLSPQTCPSCLVKHGTFHELDEPGPEDHPQGRCARLVKVKPWADLGFDVDEPEDAVTDARAWFDALPERDQVEILGRRRLDLLNAGKIAWEDLTSLRTTAGWRDSWVMTPLRELLAQSRAGRRAS